MQHQQPFSARRLARTWTSRDRQGRAGRVDRRPHGDDVRFEFPGVDRPVLLEQLGCRLDVARDRTIAFGDVESQRPVRSNGPEQDGKQHCPHAADHHERRSRERRLDTRRRHCDGDGVRHENRHAKTRADIRPRACEAAQHGQHERRDHAEHDVSRDQRSNSGGDGTREGQRGHHSCARAIRTDAIDQRAVEPGETDPRGAAAGNPRREDQRRDRRDRGAKAGGVRGANVRDGRRRACVVCPPAEVGEAEHRRTQSRRRADVVTSRFGRTRRCSTTPRLRARLRPSDA